ncbi:hypothetical protein, conserved [Eimeria maxima]|uniref:F-box domain-containing protein n=1 Tax=Eimeria maxima TaxID=5804 RepID=U6M6H4_EIMMA|nr:hypothetical protein, conserved [Eimeria maxima]CDJ59837.1 hypothetical protein, conserved [Eimeria maxima]
MPLARASRTSSKGGRRCRRRNNSSTSQSPSSSSSSSNSSSSSSSGCRGGPGDKKKGSKVQGSGLCGSSSSGVLTVSLASKSRWPSRSSQPRPSHCLDALLRENVLLAVLPFLEAADATRLGACCTDLHAALTTPRVQPLWRRWFETSGFVWWPYGGACGSSCSLKIDRDGFVLRQRQGQQELEQQWQGQGHQQQLHLQLQLTRAETRPGAGYRQFSHEGWCCQFLWNARSLHNWKTGTCAFAALHTDSHKLCMVSIHPKGVYASRAEATPLSPTAAPLLQRTIDSPVAETPRQARQDQQQQQQPHDSSTAAPLQQQVIQFPTTETPGQTRQESPNAAPPQQQSETPRQARQHHPLQQQQQQPQPQQQPQLSNIMYAASPNRLAEAEASSQPSVHFTPGVGRYVRAVLHAKPAVLTAAADRVLCIIDPLKKGPSASSTSSPFKCEGAHGHSNCCCHRAPRGTHAVSVSPVSAYAAAGSISSLASLELELESLVSGGSGGRRGSGRARKNGGSRHAAASATASVAAAGVGEGLGDHRRASGDAGAAAATSASAGEVREICRCWPRGAWLGCSVDAASGLMACSHRSTEATGSAGRGRRKKGNSGSGAAEPCEYKVFDLLQETEVAQLAIEGQLVHRLILNFIFSQNPSRAFGFDRWHSLCFAKYISSNSVSCVAGQREFFVWTISNAVPGEALETSAIVNAHTDGILGLDVTETYSSLKVLSGSRDETISLYSVDPLLRLATFTGHQAEVSAVCWLRNGEAAPCGQQGPGENRATGNGLTLLEHQNRITRLATSWDGRMLLSGDSEGLWDLRKCADSLLTAKYNGAILDLHANRAFCVVRTSPPRGRDTLHVLDFCGRSS